MKKKVAQRQLSARLRFTPQDLHCVLLSAGIRLCSHQTFNKGLFHTAPLFLRFGDIMCLGREINGSRGQPWEQSDKEALGRDLPGGPAAEAPRAHSETEGSGLVCGNGIPHEAQRRPKS